MKDIKQPSETLSQVSEVIKARRKELGWSVYRLEKESGIYHSRITELEKGGNWKRDTVLALCKALEL